ncbi:MAG: hypothetical protein R3B57_02710 [Phycisphaerales bacterium]
MPTRFAPISSEENVWVFDASLPANATLQMLLPLRPIWPGFAIDAVFYAGVCWVMLAAPGVVVRWRRRRRGRCPACGYDLAGLDACPECGGGR